MKEKMNYEEAMKRLEQIAGLRQHNKKPEGSTSAHKRVQRDNYSDR